MPNGPIYNFEAFGGLVAITAANLQTYQGLYSEADGSGFVSN
jgi:hypothetical protein